MPIEFIFTEPEQVQCVLIRVPVVISETPEAQIIVDTTFCLPEMAKKVDHIDVMVRDLEADPVFVHESESSWNMSISKKWPHFWDHHLPGGRAFLKKIIVHGVLHKQIYYVNQDDMVKHVGEDIPFTKTIDLTEPEPVIDVDDVEFQFRGARADVTWDLVRASRLQQTGVILIRIKAVEQRQLYVQVCPSPQLCPQGNLLRDPGLEMWVGNTPLLWGSTNVFRAEGTFARGTYAAGLGLDPALPAAIFQTTRAVRPGFQYRLCAQALRISPVTPNCDFTLEIQLQSFDASGVMIDTQAQSFSASQIGTTFRQFCVNVGPIMTGTAFGLVRIAMQVPSGTTEPNNCQVVVDDVTLECVGGTASVLPAPGPGNIVVNR